MSWCRKTDGTLGGCQRILLTLAMLTWRIGLATSASAPQTLPEVAELRGEADYRFVTLRWEYPNGEPHSFHVHYCELQAWAPNRCRTKLLVMEDGSGVGPSFGPSLRMYTVIVNGLKMATNYSFEVWPIQHKKASTRYLSPPPPHIPQHNRIIVTTKGFSAKASLCLPDVTEVEVSTGPFFGGRVGVEVASPQGANATGEDGADSGCWLDGDGASPKESYTLRIHHGQCGSSRVNATTVATYVLVQENLPILTHSTRRFLVLCTFQPETLTVRAGLNLPSTSSGSVEGAAEPVQLQEVTNNQVAATRGVHAAPLLQEPQHVREHHHHDHKHHQSSGESKEAKGVLAGVIVVMGLVGVGLALWWYLPKTTTSQGSVAILSEECGATVYDNYENALRDSSLDSPCAEESGVLECATSWSVGDGLQSGEGGTLVAASNRLLIDDAPVSNPGTVFTICQPADTTTFILGPHNHSEA